MDYYVLLFSAAAKRQPPCVANGVVYVDSELGSLYALNAATGATVSATDSRGFVHYGSTVANNVVYVNGGNGNIYAIGTEQPTTLTISAAPQSTSP